MTTFESTVSRERDGRFGPKTTTEPEGGTSALPRWNPADPGCTCAMGGMGRRADCPAHGIARRPTPTTDNAQEG